MNTPLPPIPAKRYFTIGEVAELCNVKPHVLRYWEQEFVQLRPMKRRGNRRYYQHHEVLMIRRIRELLYGQGFTINGARSQLQESHAASSSLTPEDFKEKSHFEAGLAAQSASIEPAEKTLEATSNVLATPLSAEPVQVGGVLDLNNPTGLQNIREQLKAIQLLLSEK